MNFVCLSFLLSSSTLITSFFWTQVKTINYKMIDDFHVTENILSQENKKVDGLKKISDDEITRLKTNLSATNVKYEAYKAEQKKMQEAAKTANEEIKKRSAAENTRNTALTALNTKRTELSTTLTTKQAEYQAIINKLLQKERERNKAFHAMLTQQNEEYDEAGQEIEDALQAAKRSLQYTIDNLTVGLYESIQALPDAPTITVPAPTVVAPSTATSSSSSSSSPSSK